MSIFLVILIMVVLFGGMIAAMIAIIRKFDPARNDSVNKVNSTKAQEFLPFEDITNNMIVLGNHRYRAVISCSSTNYQLKTNGEREQIEMSFQRFLNTISFPITFFLQTKIIDNTERLKELGKDIEAVTAEFPNMADYAEAYREEMRRLNERIGNNQQKKRYIIVTYDDSGTLSTLSDEEKVIHAEKEIKQRCHAIISNLQSVGVNASIMKTEDLVELIYSCYYRDDYSYAQAISDKEPFSLFVEGGQDHFRNVPKTKMLDLILGETINQIQLANIDTDPAGKKTLMEIKGLREKYAGYFQEPKGGE